MSYSFLNKSDSLKYFPAAAVRTISWTIVDEDGESLEVSSSYCSCNQVQCNPSSNYMQICP